MKTVCKKLFSLMLVAVLLVSALPFQAMAATKYEFTIGGYNGTDDDGSFTKDECIEFFAEGDNDEELLAEIEKMIEKVTFPVALSAESKTTIDLDTGKVSVENEKEEEVVTPPAQEEEKDPSDYVEIIRPGDDYTPKFTLRCVVNGTQTWSTKEKADGVTFGEIMDKHFTSDEGYTYKLTSKFYDKVLTSVAVPDGDTVTIHITTSYSEPTEPESDDKGYTGEEKVYLCIYLNNNTKDMAKCVEVTKYCEDGSLNRYEAERAIKKYYSPKDGYTMKMYGLFTYSTWRDFLLDPDKNGTMTVELDGSKEIYVYVLANNVKAGGVADPSNPKTGDEIFMTVTAMGLSASALIVLFFLNKKRLAE